MSSSSRTQELAHLASTLTRAEIKSMYSMLKERARTLDAQAITQLAPGQRVSFVGRGGNVVRGVITKTNIKTITIRTDSGLWRVNAAAVSAEL